MDNTVLLVSSASVATEWLHQRRNGQLDLGPVYHHLVHFQFEPLWVHHSLLLRLVRVRHNGLLSKAQPSDTSDPVSSPS
jgi:hypothetical protein